MIRYRRATLGDLGALLELERDFPGDRLSRRSFRHLLTRANAQVWVCTEAERIVGNAVVLYRGDTPNARLYSIVIAPGARGRGMAQGLIRCAEAAALRRRCRRVSLEVRSDNRAALRLYGKLGYRIVRRIDRFYEDGQAALRLERSLLPAESPAHLAA